MLKKTKRAAKNVIRKLSSSSKYSDSNPSRDQMSVDSVHRTSEPQEEVQTEVPRQHLRIRVMTRIEDIVVHIEYKREALEHLKNRSFAHHKTFDNM